MFGKAGAIIGPLLVGSMLVLTSNIRIALLPIILLFILGGIMLFFVKETNEDF